MPFGITLSTWRGQSINNGSPYTAYFTTDDSEILNTLNAPAVEIQRPQNTPLRSHSQPQGMRFAIEIVIAGTLSQSNLDQLKKWFSPLEEDLGALVGTADSGSGSSRRLMCVVEKLDVNEGVNVFTASMYAPMGLWEDTSATTPTPTDVDEASEDFTLTNPGNAPAPLVLTITADEDSPETQTKMKQCFLANRSVEPLQHFANEKYPIELTGGGIDTTSGFMANLNDLRVLLHGEPIPRWCYPTTSNASTKVWVNLHMEPGKHATLAAAIDADDNALVVDNPEGFAGWPENAWLFVDSEPMLATGISGFGVTSLSRPYPTTHDAGADIWWIEFVPSIIYGDADAEAPPDWSDQEPVIDRSVSTNAFHKMAGPFFNAENLRSRTALRRLPDTGLSHIRTYDDGDGKLRWEDSPAEAGKPPLSVVQLDFPVPLTELELDYEVEQSLVLSVKGIDYGRDGGYVSDELTALWTDGELTDETIAPANPLKRLEIEAKIGVVNGFVDTNGVGSQPSSTISWDERVDNPFYESVKAEIDEIERARRAGEILISSSLVGGGNANGSKRAANVTITGKNFTRFTLEEETVITGILIYSSYTGAWSTNIYLSNGTPVERLIRLDFAASSAGMKIGIPVGGRAVLPAGEYYFHNTQAFGVVSGRHHPNIWWGYHSVYLERNASGLVDPRSVVFHRVYSIAYVNLADSTSDTMSINEYAEVDVPNEDRHHDDKFEATPVFAVLSAETPVQTNAPVETGLIATIDNLRCTLDSDVAPLIFMGDEEAINLLDGTIENETTEQVLQILYPLVVGESISIDTDTAEVTDGVTDLPITHAVTYSAPLERMQVAPGANTVIATDLVGVTIAPTFRGRYL